MHPVVARAIFSTSTSLPTFTYKCVCVCVVCVCVCVCVRVCTHLGKIVLEDLDPAVQVGGIDSHLHIKATRPQKGPAET